MATSTPVPTASESHANPVAVKMENLKHLATSLISGKSQDTATKEPDLADAAAKDAPANFHGYQSNHELTNRPEYPQRIKEHQQLVQDQHENRDENIKNLTSAGHIGSSAVGKFIASYPTSLK